MGGDADIRFACWMGVAGMTTGVRRVERLRPALLILRWSIYCRGVRRQRGVLSEATYFILAALLDEPLHGYAVIKRTQEQSGGRVNLAVGTLYGALERMTDGGLIEVDREEVVAGRPRRYFRITALGRRTVREEAERLAAAAAVVMDRSARPKRAVHGAGSAAVARGAVIA